LPEYPLSFIGPLWGVEGDLEGSGVWDGSEFALGSVIIVEQLNLVVVDNENRQIGRGMVNDLISVAALANIASILIRSTEAEWIDFYRGLSFRRVGLSHCKLPSLFVFSFSTTNCINRVCLCDRSEPSVEISTSLT